MQKNNILVVSAHAADFVWRSGGTIAKYIKNGANVSLVVLSYGVRGESNDLWKIEGQTTDKVKEIRKSEVDQAIEILGVKDVEFWDFQDYHMKFDEERLNRLAKKIRQVRPEVIVTHAPKDAFNPDHETVSKAVFEASVLATSSGVQIDNLPQTSQSSFFGFEPHQTEISEFVPNTIIDITDTFEQKRKAMECFKAQGHLIDYYTSRAEMRGNHARRVSGNKQYKYAESFMRFLPYVGDEFV